jgi:hypothetical protein
MIGVNGRDMVLRGERSRKRKKGNKSGHVVIREWIPRRVGTGTEIKGRNRVNKKLSIED